MVRRFEKLWILAALSLLVHIGVVTLMRFLVPPTIFISAAGSTPIAMAPAIVPMPREPPKPIDRNIESEFGERTGEGDSISSLDLPNVMQSPSIHDFEQAWSTQKPVVSSPAQADPSQTKNSAALVPSGLETDLPAMSRQTIGKGSSGVEAPMSDLPPESQASDRQANDVKRKEEQKEVQTAGANPATVDPAPRGQNDLDPFAEAEGISLVGGTKARKGREIQFSRPRVDLAFRAAFTRLAEKRIRIVFQITTDETGHPRNVVILQSSGSDDIDESLRLAIFSSWFGGKMPDDFPFTIAFYD